MSDDLLTLGIPGVSLTDPLVSLPRTPVAPDQSDAETARLARKPVSEPQSNGDFASQKPIENPLHEYASYTYNLSLHMLAIDEYNEIINNNFKNTNPAPYVPKNVLISGAGRYNSTDFVRNKNFKEDFYFEDF